MHVLSHVFAGRKIAQSCENSIALWGFITLFNRDQNFPLMFLS